MSGDRPALSQTPVLPQNRRFRIGPLLVSGRTRSISDGDVVLPLPPRAVEVLLVLLAHAGETVSRADLKLSVWGGEATDDGNISKNIYVLRNALRERLGGNEVITTQSGRGYTYVGPVELEELTSLRPEAQVPDVPGLKSELESDLQLDPAGRESLHAPAGIAHSNEQRSIRKRPRGWAPRWLAISAAVLIILVAGVVRLRQRRAIEEASRPVVPPADLILNWRAVTRLEPEDQLGIQAISPTGAYFAYRDRSGTYVRLADGDGARRVTLPEGLAVDSLSWFPDERRLLVTGERGPRAGQSSTSSREAFVVPVGDGSVLPVLQDASLGAVSPDGRLIAYARANKSELWVADADGQHNHRLRDASGGDTILCILWSSQSDRVVIDRAHIQSQVQTDGSQGAVGQLQQQHDWIYESYRATDGRLLASKAGLHFESGALLPDGRLLYPNTGPTGVTRVTVFDTALDTGLILPTTDRFAEELGQQTYGASNLSASHDGKLVSLTMERDGIDVYTASLHASASGLALQDIRRLTHHAGTSYPTGWDRTGAMLLFDEGDGEHSVIARSGPGDSIKLIADTGGRAVQGHYTPDGRWILFLHYGGKPVNVQSIDRVPAAGGAPVRLISVAGLEDFHCSRSTFGRCLFRVRKNDREYAYIEFSGENGATQEVAHWPIGTSVLGDWSLSPDGLSIATSDHNPDKPVVQIIRLPGLKQGSDSHAGAPDASVMASVSAAIPVPGYGTILGASWDAEGKGFFVSAHSDAGYSLLHVDLQGASTLLKKSVWPVWGVPSWDGKKLAFPAATSGNTNVWIGRLSDRQ